MLTDQNTEIILRKQLQQLLQKRKLSAAELSRRAGVPKQTISDWLGGVPPRNVRALWNVARALGTSIEYLVFGEGVSPKAAAEAADHASAPTGWSQRLASLDQEWVMISERGLLTYMSARLAASIGLDPKEHLGRPFYELIHIDDIPSDKSWQRPGPTGIRFATPYGETSMGLHQSMALGGAELTIHHFQPSAAQTVMPAESYDLFDLRSLLKKMERVAEHPPYPGITFLSMDWNKQPLHICARHSTLGRLLLITIYELNGEAGDKDEALCLEVQADDRFYVISLRMRQDRPTTIQTQSRSWRHMKSLARSCGVGLRKSDGAIEIHGPRIFLSATASH